MSAAAEIRQFAERIVRLETERRDLAADIKDVKAEAKGQGYNVKLIAACVRLMLLEQTKQDAALAEHSELDIYLGAVGLLDGDEDEIRQDVGGRGAMPPETCRRDNPEHAGASVAGESLAPASAQIAGRAADALPSPEQHELRSRAPSAESGATPGKSPLVGGLNSRESASELEAATGVEGSLSPAGVGSGSATPSPGMGRESPGTHSAPSNDRVAA